MIYRPKVTGFARECAEPENSNGAEVANKGEGNGRMDKILRSNGCRIK